MNASVGIRSELKHLIEHVRLGDANAIWTTINGWYTRKTAHGFKEASKAFHNLNMSDEAVGLEKFINMVQRNAIAFESIGGKPGNIDKITVLLDGLIPAFDTIVTTLQCNDLSKYKFQEVADARSAIGGEQED